MQCTAYLVCGVPASGKSYACEQLTEKFEYVHHDGFIYLKQPGAYVKAVIEKARTATKPLLIEAPFSISQTKEPLEAAGIRVIPVFIIENSSVLTARYEKREGKEKARRYLPGHLSRQETFLKRALDWGSFRGTSSEVLEYLRGIA
jgi:adenylate kinase family enzyme